MKFHEAAHLCGRGKAEEGEKKAAFVAQKISLIVFHPLSAITNSPKRFPGEKATILTN